MKFVGQRGLIIIPQRTPGRLELMGRAQLDLPRTWIHSFPHIRKAFDEYQQLLEQKNREVTAAVEQTTNQE